MSVQSVPLGKYVRVVGGYAFKSRDFGDAGYPVIRISNIKNGIVHTKGAVRINPDKLGKGAKYTVKGGDILMALSGATTGKMGIVPDDIEELIYLNQRVGKFEILDNNKVERSYLRYFLDSNIIQSQIWMSAAGVAQPNVSPKQLATYNIPLPTISEQKRIAAILDKADALREKRRQTIAKLDELLQSVFLDFFNDPSTNSVWNRRKVESLASNSKGSIRTGPFGSQLLHSEFVDSGISVLGIDNAVNNEFSWGKRRFITESKYRELKRYKVFPGDVVITIMGTCGRCAIIPEDIPDAINTKHLCCITLNKEICLPEYLHSCFLVHPEVLHQLGVSAKGAVMPGLNMTIIKGLRIPVPPLDLQRKYLMITNRIKKQKEILLNQCNDIDNLFASLQQRAFKGEL